MTVTKRNYLQLVFSRNNEHSSDSAATLHGQISKPKLTVAQGLNLPGPTLGELATPHADGLSGDAECVREGLMSAAEVRDDLLKRDFGSGHDPSVSVLPRRVKPLTRNQQPRPRKLTYMSRRKPTDEWAIKRGAAMRTARAALGKSQAEIAELAGVKDRETISQYESGLIADIDPAVIPRLAMALGMPPQRLSRTPWGARDEGAELKVSNVARQIAYSFDRYPLAIQNQIRETIAKYELMVKQYGKEAADALFGPTPSQEPAKTVPMRRQRQG
jgi:transcriptional regulator with XRE-family HTH domain